MKKLLTVFLIVILVLAGGFFIIKAPVARNLNKKGIIYYKDAKYDNAEKAFSRSAWLKRDYADPLINLTKCYLGQMKFDLAEESLKKLAIIAPSHAETMGLSGQLLTIKKDFPEALEYLNQSIASDSTLAYAYFYRGIANANLGNLDAAADDYLKAQKLDQENITALEERAVILNQLNDFEGSILNYNKLLELDPSNKEAFFSRGTFKMKIGDFEGAVADFENTIRLDDHHAEAYYNKGKSHANLEQYEQAIACFRQSASMGFKESGANYNSGLAAFRMNRTKDAREYLLKSINSNDENENLNKAYNILGVLEMMNGNGSVALSCFEKSILIDSTSADVFYNRGIAFGMMKEYAKAIKDLNKCISLGRETPDVYFARGVNRISLSNFPAGCKDLKKAASDGYQDAQSMSVQYCKDYQ